MQDNSAACDSLTMNHVGRILAKRLLVLEQAPVKSELTACLEKCLT